MKTIRIIAVIEEEGKGDVTQVTRFADGTARLTIESSAIWEAAVNVPSNVRPALMETYLLPGFISIREAIEAKLSR